MKMLLIVFGRIVYLFKNSFACKTFSKQCLHTVCFTDNSESTTLPNIYILVFLVFYFWSQILIGLVGDLLKFQLKFE